MSGKRLQHKRCNAGDSRHNEPSERGAAEGKIMKSKYEMGGTVWDYSDTARAAAEKRKVRKQQRARAKKAAAIRLEYQQTPDIPTLVKRFGLSQKTVSEIVSCSGSR